MKYTKFFLVIIGCTIFSVSLIARIPLKKKALQGANVSVDAPVTETIQEMPSMPNGFRMPGGMPQGMPSMPGMQGGDGEQIPSMSQGLPSGMQMPGDMGGQMQGGMPQMPPEMQKMQERMEMQQAAHMYLLIKKMLLQKGIKLVEQAISGSAKDTEEKNIQEALDASQKEVMDSMSSMMPKQNG